MGRRSRALHAHGAQVLLADVDGPQAAAKELAHHGVRVNAVQPGLIRTAMTAAMSAGTFAATESTIPMRRAGRPDEVAGAVVFLASDLASYITGAVLEVSGGRGM